MKFIILFFGLLANIIAFEIAASPDSRYPDPKLTPGVITNADKAAVCKVGYTKDERHVTEAMKKEVFKRYGFVEGSYKQNDYEVDHFLSIENYGDNSIENLWPQKFCKIGNKPLVSGCWGAREKDRVETELHRWMCKNIITKDEDLEILKTDWVGCYKTISKGGVCHSKK